MKNYMTISFMFLTTICSLQGMDDDAEDSAPIASIKGTYDQAEKEWVIWLMAIERLYTTPDGIKFRKNQTMKAWQNYTRVCVAYCKEEYEKALEEYCDNVDEGEDAALQEVLRKKSINYANALALTQCTTPPDINNPFPKKEPSKSSIAPHHLVLSTPYRGSGRRHSSVCSR